MSNLTELTLTGDVPRGSNIKIPPGVEVADWVEQQKAKLPYDNVNPEHYRRLGEYSALHVVHRWGLNYCLGNALKYIQRAGTKPGASTVEDLKKAVWYIQREIHQLDPSEPDPAANRGD